KTLQVRILTRVAPAQQRVVSGLAARDGGRGNPRGGVGWGGGRGIGGACVRAGVGGIGARSGGGARRGRHQRGLGRQRQAGRRRRVDFGDARRERHGHVGQGVGGAVLVRIVLKRGGEAYRRVALQLEGRVVSAAAQAVLHEQHVDLHRRHVALTRLAD